MEPKIDPYQAAREAIEADPNGGGSLAAIFQRLIDLEARVASLLSQKAPQTPPAPN